MKLKDSGSEYILTEKTDRSICRKISDLQVQTGTKYAIFPTLVTTCGLVSNSYSDRIQAIITMDDLFAV